MRHIDHPREHQSLGRQTQVSSLHVGASGARPKVSGDVLANSVGSVPFRTGDLLGA